uniref:PDZ domain-containing protein n=1 Tax=Alexandrium catenella TaxID=2925 RepID=A0A7S1SEG0_ALECA|mmetsp:Transcript_97901/g.260062  ORF Transcript_97901/g.260062 Transcript_97901/m.260062 type:complete len:336 (+) Transcript_97901:74-1081(+)
MARRIPRRHGGAIAARRALTCAEITLLLLGVFGATTFVGLRGTSGWHRPPLLRHPDRGDPAVSLRASGEEVWGEALEVQRERSEALLARLGDLRAKLGGRRLEGESAAVRKLREDSSGGSDAFEKLRAANDALQGGLEGLEGIARLPPVVDARPPSLPEDSRLAGLDVPVDVLPPVGDFGDRALVPGAPHVRVTLPLDDDQAVLWGSDLTPFFDQEGDRLMVFVAELPLGMQVGEAERPAEAPVRSLSAIVVEAVGERGQAERLGIRPGDYLRAVSRMGDGIEPGFLDKMLGAEAVKMKDVLKVDGLTVQEVTEAILSNEGSPDGKLTLLLERPP